MNTSQNINEVFDNSLISEELTNITSELTEAGIDTFLQEGVLRDLPAIGILVGLIKIGATIKDRLFLKKIIHFLYQLKNIPGSKRESFIKKINTEKKFKTKVGETIMLLIDKLNDYSKADYLGKLFAACIDGKIEYNTFLKLANIVDKSYIPDLNNLIPIYHGRNNEVDDTDKDILYNLGLLINLGVDGKTYMFRSEGKVPNKRNQLEINKYGKLIVELLFDKGKV